MPPGPLRRPARAGALRERKPPLREPRRHAGLPPEHGKRAAGRARRVGRGQAQQHRARAARVRAPPSGNRGTCFGDDSSARVEAQLVASPRPRLSGTGREGALRPLRCTRAARTGSWPTRARGGARRRPGARRNALSRGPNVPDVSARAEGRPQAPRSSSCSGCARATSTTRRRARPSRSSSTCARRPSAASPSSRRSRAWTRRPRPSAARRSRAPGPATGACRARRRSRRAW